jgi:ABC-2 type transport system ATP-binding protein
VIEARAICKSFGTTRALIDVDLVADAGRGFALLGPNGAGKTTLVRILTTVSVTADTVSALSEGGPIATSPGSQEPELWVSWSCSAGWPSAPIAGSEFRLFSR